MQTHTYQSPRLALRLPVAAVRARDVGLRKYIHWRRSKDSASDQR